MDQDIDSHDAHIARVGYGMVDIHHLKNLTQFFLNGNNTLIKLLVVCSFIDYASG